MPARSVQATDAAIELEANMIPVTYDVEPLESVTSDQRTLVGWWLSGRVLFVEDGVEVPAGARRIYLERREVVS